MARNSMHLEALRKKGMKQQLHSKPEYREARAAEAKSLSRKFRLNLERVSAVVERLKMESVRTPSQRCKQKFAFRPDLREALIHLPKSAALSMFEAGDLVRIGFRAFAYEELINGVLITSAKELGGIIDRGSKLLKAHRASIIETGHADLRIKASKTLRAQLTNLYPTKGVPRIDANSWNRGSESLGLGKVDFITLTLGRTSLLEVKIALLERLAEGLRREDSEYMWTECLSALKSGLDGGRIDHLSRIDELYGELGSKAHEAGEDSACFIGGGLATFFALMCLSTKTIAMEDTRVRLHRNLRAALRNTGQSTGRHSYYQVVGSKAERSVNNSCDAYLPLLIEERKIGESFYQRVGAAIQKEFPYVVQVPVKVPRDSVKSVTLGREFISSLLEERLNEFLSGMHPVANEEKGSWHSSDYRTVWIDLETPMTLNERQARVIKALDKARRTGVPGVTSEVLQLKADYRGRLRDVFKSRPQVWNSLIDSSVRGIYRLRVPNGQFPA